MKKITVLLICVLFYASVIQIVASTDEITEARISGENDAQGFQWKYFAASYMTTNASVIAIMLTYWTNEKLLHNSLNNIQTGLLVGNIRGIRPYTHSGCAD